MLQRNNLTRREKEADGQMGFISPMFCLGSIQHLGLEAALSTHENH